MLPLLCAPGPAPQRRPAFTLIELMVAMFLLAIIAGLGVYVVMNINNDAGAPRGAVMVQQTLMIAKQTALRTQRPTGVRFTLTSVPDPSNAANTIRVATSLQYIQQPDDFAVQAGTTSPPFLAIYSPVATNLALVGLIVAQPPFGGFSGNVQAGDYLVVNDGLPHRIASVVSTTQLLLNSPLQTTITSPGTTNYRIIRAPRTTGEEAIQLPLNIGVDVSTNLTNPTTMSPNLWVSQPLPGQSATATTIDIVFSPAGAVVGNNVPGVDALYLWVRDYTFPLFQGDNTLVAVYTRTGMVAAHPVNQTTGADPYSFTKDGRASGN